MSSEENKRPTKCQIENDYLYNLNLEILRAIEKSDFYFLNRELLKSRKRKLSKELAKTIIKNLSNETYFHKSSANLASAIHIFSLLNDNDYREIHKILLGKVFEMRSYFYGGFIVSEMVNLLIERGEYDWAINFSSKLFKYLDEEWQTSGWSNFCEFDKKFLKEIRFSDNPARLTKERCIEKIAEKEYKKGEKEKALQYFKNAITEGTREDAKKVVLATILQFLKKQKDKEISNDISNFIDNYYKEDSQFIEFFKWLKKSLKI